MRWSILLFFVIVVACGKPASDQWTGYAFADPNYRIKAALGDFKSIEMCRAKMATLFKGQVTVCGRGCPATIAETVSGCLETAIVGVDGKLQDRGIATADLNSGAPSQH